MLIRLMTIYYSTAIISILNALPLIQYFIDFASIPLIDARQSLSKPSTTDERNLRVNARLSLFTAVCRLMCRNYFRLYLEACALYLRLPLPLLVIIPPDQPVIVNVSSRGLMIGW